MRVHADALPLALERAGAPRWRQAAARSDQDLRAGRELDKCEAGRDAYPLYDNPCNHRGAVVWASAWLAFYVIAALHDFIASGN